MVREDIIEGIRAAMTRGQTLRQAMMSFYNAGYIKEEIEEAARTLQQRMRNPMQPQFAPASEAPIFQRGQSIKKDTGEKPKEILSQTAQLAKQTPSKTQQPVQNIQRVSAYGKTEKVKKRKLFSRKPKKEFPPVSQPLPPPQSKPQPVSQPLPTPQPVQKPLPSPQPVSQPVPPQKIPPQTIPRVSAYGPSQPYYPNRPQKPTGRVTILLLLVLLILLIGALVAILFFKEEILAFFDSF